MINVRNVKVNNAQEATVEIPHVEYRQMNPDEFWKAMTFTCRTLTNSFPIVWR